MPRCLSRGGEREGGREGRGGEGRGGGGGRGGGRGEGRGERGRGEGGEGREEATVCCLDVWRTSRWNTSTPRDPSLGQQTACQFHLAMATSEKQLSTEEANCVLFFSPSEHEQHSHVDSKPAVWQHTQTQVAWPVEKYPNFFCTKSFGPEPWAWPKRITEFTKRAADSP